MVNAYVDFILEEFLIMKKLRWMLLIMFVSITIFTVIYIYSGRYVWNYFSAIGVRSGMTREQLVRSLGEPNDVYFRGFVALVQYDGINFLFNTTQSGVALGTMFGIEFIGSDIRLGRQRIGVGSTREEILRAYENRRNAWAGIVNDSDGKILRVRDGNAWLHFHLDENDKVEIITMWLHSPI